jgi:hypothetical protein
MKEEGWDIAWWHSTHLSWVRPWVRSKHQKKKRQKKKNERRVSNLPILSQYTIGINSQINTERERNKRDLNGEGRNQITIICRWYDSILTRP